MSRHEARESQLQVLNGMPLYPTEDIIWNEAVVPTEYYNGNNCLALPKLNLQFLTLHDYLLRNFQLFRLESTCKKFYFFYLMLRHYLGIVLCIGYQKSLKNATVQTILRC